jgi:hypothetical protein
VNLRAEARRILAERELDRRRCKQDLSLLVDRDVDGRREDRRGLPLPPERPQPVALAAHFRCGTRWRRTRSAFLKARQLGITWLAAAGSSLAR